MGIFVLSFVGRYSIFAPADIALEWSIPSEQMLQISSSSVVYANITTKAEERAQEQIEQTKSQLKFIKTLERILKLLYLVLRPLLAIAGASMDNSLVYGSVFYLDTMLRKFWQIIRTFANFTIGFVFIASILSSFFWQKLWWKELKDIIKNTFIAGILIQMSWWIFAVLIDLSTIGVVAFGSLPLNVLESGDTALGNLRFLKSHAITNLDTEVSTETDQVDHNVIYSCTGGTVPTSGTGATESTDTKAEYYIPCWINNGKFIPEKGTDKDEPKTWIDYKKEFVSAWKDNKTVKIEEDGSNVSDQYCIYGYGLVKNKRWKSLTCKLLDDIKKGAADGWFREMQRKKCSRLSDLTKWAEGMTGPFFALYASVMRMSNLAITTNTKGMIESSLSFLMRVVIGAALVMPLFALAVVLVIRAVLLWLLIAFSPFLTLLIIYKFSGSESMGKVGGGSLTDIKDILWLIFMPIFVVFAISLSLIFLNLIAQPDLISESENACQQDPVSVLWCIKPIEREKTDLASDRCYDFCGITDICFTNSQSTVWSNVLNVMWWLVTSFFGIALMWVLVFTALKTSKITSGIVSTIEGRWKRIAKVAPIIPVPWLGMQSLGTLGQVKNKVNAIPNQISQKQWENSVLADKLDWFNSKLSGSNDATKKKLEETANNANSTKQEAQTNVENIQTAAGTDYTDLWEKNLAKNYARAAGLSNPDIAKISNMDDALNNQQVVEYLAGSDKALYDKMTKSLVNKNSPAKKQALAKKIKTWLNNYGTAISWGVGASAISPLAGGGYAQLYQVENSLVQYITEDDQGKDYKGLKTYTFSDTLNTGSSVEDITKFGKVISNYGDITQLPWTNTLYDGLVNYLKSTFSNQSDTKVTIDGKVIEVTKNESNVITGVSATKAS